MQILGFVVGLMVLTASMILGFFLLAGFLGFALIVGLVFYMRLWWLRRQIARRGGEEEILETEYYVVRKSDRDRRD